MESIEDFNGRLVVGGKVDGIMEDAAKSHKDEVGKLLPDPAHLLTYSDDSLIEQNGIRSVGLGVAAFCQVFTRARALGEIAEVYDAEIEGVKWAAVDATRYARQRPTVKHLYFYACNTSALGNAFDPGNNPGQEHALVFRQRPIDFLNANLAHTVEFAWSPGHMDFDGTERADALAKEAAEAVLLGRTRTTLTYA